MDWSDMDLCSTNFYNWFLCVLYTKGNEIENNQIKKKKTRNISIKSGLSRFYKDVEVFFHEILVRAIIAYQWKERLVCSLKKIYVSKFATKQKKKEAYLQFEYKSHVIVEYLPVLPTVINIFYVSENSKLR